MESPSDLNRTPGAPREERLDLDLPFEPVSLGNGIRQEEEPADGPPLLRIHLLYEDSLTQARATQLMRSLADNLKLEADFLITSTVFTLLASDDPMQPAAIDKSEPDILLVSAHGQGELPAGLVAWVEDWLQRESARPRALVISFDPEAEGTVWASKFHSQCQTHARLRSVDVFSHFGYGSQREREFSVDDLQYRAETKTALLDETLRWSRPSSHWGINE